MSRFYCRRSQLMQNHNISLTTTFPFHTVENQAAGAAAETMHSQFKNAAIGSYSAAMAAHERLQIRAVTHTVEAPGVAARHPIPSHGNYFSGGVKSRFESSFRWPAGSLVGDVRVCSESGPARPGMDSDSEFADHQCFNYDMITSLSCQCEQCSIHN